MPPAKTSVSRRVLSASLAKPTKPLARSTAPPPPTAPSADTAPCDTAPCDTAPCDTAPCDTAPGDDAPCDASLARLVPRPICNCCVPKCLADRASCLPMPPSCLRTGPSSGEPSCGAPSCGAPSRRHSTCPPWAPSALLWRAATHITRTSRTTHVTHHARHAPRAPRAPRGHTRHGGRRSLVLLGALEGREK